MLNKLTIGVVQNLDDEFGVTVYIDDVEQDLDTPCFLVTPRIATENQLLANRYERHYPFIVQYFPKEKDYHAECNDVIERLLNCLECVVADGDIVRGENMTANVIDGVLNFEVTYKMHVRKVSTSVDTENMGELSQNIDVKE